MRYEWIYAYGFVHPATGRSVLHPLPLVTAAWMSLALREFAAEADPNSEKILVLLVNNAGWHWARALEIPPNVILHFLQADTPELQPAEPL